MREGERPTSERDSSAAALSSGRPAQACGVAFRVLLAFWQMCPLC